MTVKVLEHDGVYTAYRLVVKRGDDGRLYESVKRIYLSFPPIDETKWPTWVTSLNPDDLDASLQVWFDRWNFGTGHEYEARVYQLLCDERDRRRIEEDPPVVVKPSKLQVRG